MRDKIIVLGLSHGFASAAARIIEEHGCEMGVGENLARTEIHFAPPPIEKWFEPCLAREPRVKDWEQRSKQRPRKNRKGR